VLVGLPQGVGGLVLLFYYRFVCISFYFILVYFYNMHQMIVGLPQGICGLANLF
jgi:hypothetical protein